MIAHDTREQMTRGPPVIYSDASLDVFLKGFAARDIANPLPSFDEATSADSIAQDLRIQRLNVCGIRVGGFNAGWLTLDDLLNIGSDLQFRSISDAMIVSDREPLNRVVTELKTHERIFVSSLDQISGVIQRTNLDRPAMRMWLFGLVTISELRVTRAIDETCPDESWRQYLSQGRLKLAEQLQSERRRRGDNPALLDCLQLVDKGQIVARDARLRGDSRFSSRRDVEEFVQQLQHLRNNLAHSQPIETDWDVIADLATNLHRVVLGNDKDACRGAQS